MDSQRDRIVVQLSKFSNGTAEGTIQGGRYVLDPDTIRQVIKNYKDIADSYNRSVVSAQPMQKITPMADEFVSGSFVAKANASGASYIAYCDHYAGFYLREAQKCQDALDAYLGVEEHAILEVGKTDDGGSPPAF